MKRSRDGADPADPREWAWQPSRREFMVTSAAGAAAAATMPLLDSSAEAGGAAAQVVGPGGADLVLWVNGTRRPVQAEPRETLAKVLRERLGLTGTKVGCDRAACSACTVLLDGVPVLACTTLAVDVGERKVTTIEGLADGEKLHPVQEAFVAHDALQCGFCTPGMVMSAAALLVRNPEPSAGEVKAAVGGNLCRCGCHPNIIKATLSVADARRGARGGPNGGR